MNRSLRALIAGLALALGGCGGGSGTGSATPGVASAAPASVRFVDGASVLQTAGGVTLGNPFLTVDGTTIASEFGYATVSGRVALAAGPHSIKVYDSLGYLVGPIAVNGISAGGSYTVVLVGAGPHYQTLTFADPASTNAAGLTLYEASTQVKSVDYGTFSASSGAGFKRLGAARYGDVSTVPLGASVKNVGAYVGTGTTPLSNGTITLAQIDAFDTNNRLPFHAATRLSLIFLDLSSAGTGPLVGLLDQ